MWRPIVLLAVMVGSTLLADDTRAVALGDVDEATAWASLTKPWENLPDRDAAVPERSEELVRKTVHIVRERSDCYETRRLVVGYQPFGYYVVEDRRCALR